MTIGSLFSGYGGLDLAASAVLDAETVWFCDNDPAASAVLAHHWPDTSNLGDVTSVDWSVVEPVDVLTAGWPCQDISNAGKRAGIGGERSGLWRHVEVAVGVLRPRLVVLENVGAVTVRGLGTVLGDLAALGFDAEWTAVRASEAGAPHRRERFFCVAADTSRDGRHEWWPEPAGVEWRSDAPVGGDVAPVYASRAGLAVGRIEPDWGEREAAQRGDRQPAVRGATTADPDRGGRWSQGVSGVGRPLGVGRSGTRDSATAPNESPESTWGVYAPAINRWERVLGRPAPDPIVFSERYLKSLARRRAGKDQRPAGMRGSLRPSRVLSPRFVEWMQGLEPGWVTDVPGLARNDMLRLLGNGVVPQQAEAALRYLLPLLDTGRAAA